MGHLKIKVEDGISIYKEKNNTFNGSILFKAILSGVFIGSINGFFGGGGGMICVPVLTNICNLEEKKAHATTIFIMFPLCLVSFIIYLISGNGIYKGQLFIVGGVIVGGVIGSMLLKKMSNNIINIVFIVITLYGGIRLLF